MPLFACQNQIPVITSCPPAGSKVLLFDVTGSTQYKGMALMDLATFKCCLLYQMFGAGILTITGNDLVLGIYQNTNLVGSLLVYAWNVPNLLIEGTQWDYVRNGSGVVVGIEIFIGYEGGDMFTIIPNPSCTGTPAEAFPEGINERDPMTGLISGIDSYDMPWTTQRRTKYGAIGSFLVYQDDGAGNFIATAIQGQPNDPENPTIFTFGLNSIDSFIVIS